MKYIGLSLCLALFFNPLLANTETQVPKKPIHYSKTVTKVVSALAKTAIGLGLIGFFTYGAILVLHDTADIQAAWVTIETELSSGKRPMEKFNALPALRTLGVIVYGAAITTGAFALNSAANDLQFIKTEPNE